ncbi:2-dehydro-3-deoxygalactonokinase [Aliiroseovarius sp. Z3]|uniref:2-dehydro-3-deoxygalactonokinase n=1 Tax=Aliiroseovarius sp. Z3 TaxID=2811402 RepID=UPI0023B2AFB3|nr:2-dehydro-3-deoxygalactonokinase [Aliiroseovarius sp. Z3]MDE9449826.1 2-dehydro-3-deoxygalactonokinase [Aliiroseovarius sp. Z3]
MSVTAKNPDWIAVDWGTTHLRVWLMSAEGVALDHRSSDNGMGGLARDGFQPVLQAMLSDVLGTKPLPVIICGMAGSRQGWAEAPYATAPCPPPGIVQATRFASDGMDVHILPGVKQTSPADVMRGEETQIAGFLTREPGFDGILCLPGSHTKWVQISAGEIVSFRTYMTGEMFALLGQQSVLRHSVDTSDWDQAAFDAGLPDTLSRPADLAAKLFSIRAETLLQNLPAPAARARLSALLIGAELASAKPYWLGQEVVVIGATQLAKAYQGALAQQGVAARSANVGDLTLDGLTAAYQQMTEGTQ